MRAYFEGEPDTYVFKNIRTMFGRGKKKKDPPLRLSEIIALNDRYKEWQKSSDVADVSVSVLSFLNFEGMLNVEKIREVLGEK